MSETIRGFVCLFVLLLLLNSTSFVFTDDFSAVILSKIEDSDSTALQRPIQL